MNWSKNFSKLENFYLTIKKLKLEIIDSSEYYKLAFKLGIPERGLSKLKEQLFVLRQILKIFMP